jgi:hypothetical protein
LLGKFVDEKTVAIIETAADFNRMKPMEAIPNSKDYACHPPRSELRG